MSDDRSANAEIENRLAAARPAEHVVSAKRLDEMIERGTTELHDTEAVVTSSPNHTPRVGIDPDASEMTLDESASVASASGRLRPALLAPLAAAAAIVVALVIGGRDEAPQPVEVANQPVDSPLDIAWLGVEPDERTPDRPIVGGHRLRMDENEIALIWAAAGDDNDRTGIVYELRRLTVEPGATRASLMTAADFSAGETRYAGPDKSFVDTAVEPGTEYIYGVVALSGPRSGEITWRTDVYAITDEEPPAPVTNFRFKNDKTLAWDHPAPDDVVTFQAYWRTGDTYERMGVAYGRPLELPIRLSTTPQTQFVLVAIDTHGNVSPPATLTIPE